MWIAKIAKIAEIEKQNLIADDTDWHPSREN